VSTDYSNNFSYGKKLNIFPLFKLSQQEKYLGLSFPSSQSFTVEATSSSGVHVDLKKKFYRQISERTSSKSYSNRKKSKRIAPSFAPQLESASHRSVLRIRNKMMATGCFFSLLMRSGFDFSLRSGSRSDLMRIRILLLIQWMKICDHRSPDPARLHCERPRPSMATCWASTTP
jgi:hypothetical protein